MVAGAGESCTTAILEHNVRAARAASNGSCGLHRVLPKRKPGDDGVAFSPAALATVTIPPDTQSYAVRCVRVNTIKTT